MASSPPPACGAIPLITFFITRNSEVLPWGLKCLRKADSKNRRRNELAVVRQIFIETEFKSLTYQPSASTSHVVYPTGVGEIAQTPECF